MATIDYKEKYMQALERARQFSEKPYLEDSAGIVEYIFPELKESEDEKVEKAIFEMIYDSDNELWSSYGVSKSDVLAWLEKQSGKELVTCPICGWEFEKQGEQKPADDIERKYNQCYNMSFEESQEYISNRGFDIPWTDCDVFVDFRYVTQTVANILRWADDNPIQKPAWSEEDEKMLDEIHEFFDKHKINPIKHDMDDYAKFIKSLKDRVQPQSQWKPSEEQMEYLAKAIVTLSDEGDCKTASILNDLRFELKKLREE